MFNIFSNFTNGAQTAQECATAFQEIVFLNISKGEIVGILVVIIMTAMLVVPTYFLTKPKKD